MAQVSHRTLMQMLFMSMAVRPNALLSKCALGIKKIWMSLKLDVAGLTQPLLMGVMISPGKKFSSRLLATLQERRTAFMVQGLVSMPLFCSG
jgi:hypothetical protein